MAAELLEGPTPHAKSPTPNSLAFGLAPMLPRSYLVFGDIEGKLDVLRVECTKCERKGRYHLHKLIKKYT